MLMPCMPRRTCPEHGTTSLGGHACPGVHAQCVGFSQAQAGTASLLCRFCEHSDSGCLDLLGNFVGEAPALAPQQACRTRIYKTC